jgi:hypothetical protein
MLHLHDAVTGVEKGVAESKIDSSDRNSKSCLTQVIPAADVMIYVKMRFPEGKTMRDRKLKKAACVCSASYHRFMYGRQGSVRNLRCELW